ncbi:MAG: radical SAM family heme chaperone HemW [Bacteroidetes bacterium]|nr:radical SAM family heme chaperone HemW [Bacteroidota bacterium]MDA1118929.1 radical SAM family heme chaperone HemW [Bacteroidota bacterium]
MAGIYIHIPYCRQACHYCDFHFSTNFKTKNELIKSISREMELRKGYLKDEPVESIYFGGGTPSLLEESEIRLLIDQIRENHSVERDVEITFEANPENLSIEYLECLKSLGINRISIGIQSFNDLQLKYLNRNHNANEAINSFENARRVGFDNINIDLIYGISEENTIWQANISQALDLSPEHISAYCLTIEEKTVFGNWHKTGKLLGINEETGASHFESAHTSLSKAGFQHYEISNFCKPGLYAKHNTSYWKNRKYLGVGPGAHSYDMNTRQYNVSNNALYIKSLNGGNFSSKVEKLTTIDKVNECLLTGLRTIWGCNLEEINNKHGIDLLEKKIRSINHLLSSGLGKLDKATLSLTTSGWLIADKIVSDLMID